MRERPLPARTPTRADSGERKPSHNGRHGIRKFAVGSASPGHVRSENQTEHGTSPTTDSGQPLSGQCDAARLRITSKYKEFGTLMPQSSHSRRCGDVL
jgi:hypothetical protein